MLPFKSLSDSPDQEYFAIGLTEDIITRLSRFPEFLVFARDSTSSVSKGTSDVREVRQELGAKYVIKGSVRKAAEKVRVSVQAIDAENGAHLWGKIYDRELTVENLFAIQDEITEMVAGEIADSAGVLIRIEQAAIKDKPTESLDAYECVLRGIAHYDFFTPSTHLKARDCLERAVEVDPNYADAWARLAMIYFDEHTLGFNPRPGSIDRAFWAAQNAVRADEENAMAHSVLAEAHFYRHEVDEFFAEAERSIRLNPNKSEVLAGVGMNMVWAGALDRGFELLNKARVLNPKHQSWYYFPLSAYHYERREYQRALEMALRLNLPDVTWTYMWLAISYGQLGRTGEARAAADELTELDPAFIGRIRQEWAKFNRPREAVEHIVDGLRKAGLDIPDESTEAD